ncbi:DUF7668 domain-containing protein [Xanthomonas euroxanthea]|uniref:DUF7668 domain-containing protein n=1 Tax=Xanthomonas euroxanthea TaxID=2259622 RepID=UPI003CCD7ACA
MRGESEQRSVPNHWRQVFRDVVAAFATADYRLGGIPGVEPISSQTATQIQRSIHSYGATLTALPDETWGSSVCIWTGSNWDVLVDLWTQEEGRGDLVLHAQVTDAAFSVKVHLVYVP